MRVAGERVVFGIVLALAAYVSNFRSLIFWSLHPVTGELSQQVWIEVGYWLLAMLLVLWLLVRERVLADYFRTLAKEPILIVFLSICLASAFWSENPAVTIFHAFVLIASSCIAAYLGMRCSLEQMLRYLCWLAVVVVLASIYTVLANPGLGIDSFYGPGVWRGIFWNKNHVGALTALFSVLMLLTIVQLNARSEISSKAWIGLTYVAALVLVYKAHSAAGYMLLLILHAIVLLQLLWLRFAKHMQRRHYLLAAGVGILVILVPLSDLDAVFRPFNRDATLTGRTKLWTYLLEEVVSAKPFFGHGFGSLWGDLEFQARAKARLHWVPLIGDNGFIDVLLGVGIVGLAAFLLLYLVAWSRAIRCLVRNQTIASCLPLLVMSFSLFANISFSLLTEIEVMVWGLIVATFFMTGGSTIPLPNSDGALVNTHHGPRSP